MTGKELGEQPAFPQHGWSSSPETIARMSEKQGISTRALLAGMAMQGMAASDNWSGSFDGSKPEYLADVAQIAAKAADALLVELAKEQP